MIAWLRAVLECPPKKDEGVAMLSIILGLPLFLQVGFPTLILVSMIFGYGFLAAAAWTKVEQVRQRLALRSLGAVCFVQLIVGSIALLFIH